MLVPVKTLARERGRVARVAMTNGQMQRHHTVATACVRERVRQRFCRGGDARMLVPVKAVTSERGRVARVTVTDS